jgi:CheY-like chemotaxis protein
LAEIYAIILEAAGTSRGSFLSCFSVGERREVDFYQYLSKEVKVIDMTSLLDLKYDASKEASREVILVVEDDEGIREVLSVCIETQTPYRVLSIESGEETLQRIEEVKAAHPILFILDYLLLTMTAFQLYDHLHSLEECEHTPAIILTAATPNLWIDSAVAERGLEMLAKPFDVDELLDCIEQTLLCTLKPAQ